MRRWRILISLLVWVGCAGEAERAETESAGTGQAALCKAPVISASRVGPVPIGATIALSASPATCGAGETAEYRFLMRRDGATSVYAELRPYSPNPQFDLQTTGLLPGKYTVQVYVRAVGSTVVRDAAANVTLLIGPTCSAVNLSASPGSPQLPGPTVQVTATATCSEGAAAEHRLLAKLANGSYVEVAGWRSSALEWETAALPRGPYTLLVHTRGVGNASNYEASRTLDYRLGAQCTQLTGTMTPALAASAGSTVGISALATCSSGTDADYQFSYRAGSSGAFQIVAPWGPSAQIDWNTAGLSNGPYQVKLEARANDYPWPAQVTKTLAYSIGGVCSAATLTASPKSPQPIGALLTLTSSATCTSSPIEYRFLRKDSLASDYSELAPFGSSASFAFDSQGSVPGPHTFQVQARVQGGSAVPFSKTAAYQLGDVCTSVTLRATPSSPQPAGTPVEAVAAVRCVFGGVPEYRFAVRTGAGPWQTIRDWAGPSVSLASVGLGEGVHTLRVEARGQGHPGAPESSRTLAYTFAAPCAPGYQSNGFGCIDIDECATNNGGCSAVRECVNEPGGFACGPCPSGYVTSGSSGCADVDECATNNGGCDPLTACSNVDGGRLCGPCPAGYAEIGGSCVDLNECGINSGGCNPLRECLNLPGGWECGPCPPGFGNDGNFECQDIDECATDNGGCDPLTVCSNTLGGRDCSPCPPGYTGSGVSGCQDVDECAVDNGGCDPLTDCVNSTGSFACSACPPGYTGSGSSECQDVDECGVNNGGCDPLTSCLNSPGGFSCGPCPPGYSGNGQSGCIPPNVCSPNPCQNGGSCSPSGANYACTCIDGYGGKDCEIAPVTLLAAGDIGDCNTTTDTATGLLLGEYTGPILPLGDIAYPNGSASDFTNCFNPPWGAHRARMRPVVGNHEYQTPNASGYFNYFGAAAGEPAKGYYSYDLGTWHIVALNTNCTNVSCSAGSAQEQWLRQDLAARPGGCTLAYFHHPRFSSGGTHGNNAAVSAIWRALVDHGVELALAGHDHNYERFAPQDDNAVATPNGVVQFVVGTGGTALRPLGTIKANSVARNSTVHGVLNLTLSAGSYSYAFVPIAGKAYADSGTASCH
jgi:hypothetical protein